MREMHTGGVEEPGPRRLDLSHYETLVAVIDTGSVTAAANVLNLSQSALSHRLAEAERRLGHTMFERRPARTIQPSPAALGLYQAAKRVLPELVRAERQFLEQAATDRHNVRVGVAAYDCFHWLPGFTRHLDDVLGDIRLEIAIAPDAPAEALATSTADLMITPGWPIGQYRSWPLFTDELVVVLPPDHPALRADSPHGGRWFGPDQVSEEVYLTYSRVPAPGFEFERFFRPAGVSARATVVVERTSAICEMVSAGSGISILSRWTVDPWLQTGAVRALPCGQDGLPLGWRYMVRPAAEDHHPEVRVGQLLAQWMQDSLPATAG